MPAMSETRIYKALRPEEIAPSEAAGIALTALDQADGFVHLSAADQIAETLARHLAGADGVLLLEYTAESFGNALKWEPSRGGDHFPHVYGAVPLDQARRRWTLDCDESGRHRLPADFHQEA
ncbi:MAG: DUF952 domain-containing protein [Pseudomonadota bacterium]